MRIPATARMGIGAIVVAVIVFSCATYWLRTRRLLLVDIPISLSRGSIRTGQFEINRRAVYSILIRTDDGNSLSCYENSVLQTRRLNFVGGGRVGGLGADVAPLGRDITFGPFLGTFDGKPGEYSLEIEVLTDASCLNSGHPRLTIEAIAAEYNRRDDVYAFASLLALVAGTVGVVLVIVGVNDDRRVRSRVYGSTEIFR